jgi:hypothetical protein
MIHTVYIDDSTVNGRRVLEDMQKNNEGIEFEENNISVAAEPVVEYVKSGEKNMNDTSAEYMTSDEFRKKSRKDIDNLCKKYGLL